MYSLLRISDGQISEPIQRVARLVGRGTVSFYAMAFKPLKKIGCIGVDINDGGFNYFRDLMRSRIPERSCARSGNGIL